MNWLEMFAIFVISFLVYLIATGLFGVMIVDAVNDHDGFPWGAWAFGAFIFICRCGSCMGLWSAVSNI